MQYKHAGVAPLKIILTIISLVILTAPVISQRINFKAIPQKKIRNFIKTRAIDKLKDFSLIHPSWKKNSDVKQFHFNEKVFYIDDKIDNVWQCYSHADLTKTLSRPSMRFGLLIEKASNSVFYTDSLAIPAIDTGQVYFFDLRILRGVLNIPVAFEVITIDPENEKLELSYIENNKSRGKQTIQFFDGGKDNTRIVHTSYFKSNSGIRDNLFYPHFHKKFIKNYHRNMRHLLEI
jgi:hypothetical protein